AALGLVSRMPSGPGVIADDQIAEIAARVPPGVDTFLLTSQQEIDTIIEQHSAARTSVLQIVDDLPPDGLAQLRSALPGIRLVQVIHVTGEDAIEMAERAARWAHAILLDSGNPNLATKELGGTGRRHNWAISARIRTRLGVPVFLAGGLDPDNATEALTTVRPFGLDVCSGLRDSAFDLDPNKLARFADAVNSGAHAVG
ncbi:MAG: phosphoribosylanthranilate isomerase, partial [Pseudonocardiaceae bacterium]